MDAKQPKSGNASSRALDEYDSTRREVLGYVFAEERVPEELLRKLETTAEVVLKLGAKATGMQFDPARAKAWAAWKRSHNDAFPVPKMFAHASRMAPPPASRRPSSIDELRWRCKPQLVTGGMVPEGEFRSTLSHQHDRDGPGVDNPYSSDGSYGSLETWTGYGNVQWYGFIATDSHGENYTRLTGSWTRTFEVPDGGPYELRVKSRMFAEAYLYSRHSSEGDVAHTILTATHGLYVRVPVPPNPPDLGFDGNSFTDLWDVHWWFEEGDALGWPTWLTGPHAGEDWWGTQYWDHEAEVRLRCRGPGAVTAVESISYYINTSKGGLTIVPIAGNLSQLQWELWFLPCDFTRWW